MTSWIDAKKAEVIASAIDLTELNVALVTDKKLKRKHYKCGEKFVTLPQVPLTSPKVSIWRGDITTIEIDCIVNSANEGLLGGGGIDEAIHKAAGPLLQRECAGLPLCLPGNAVITKGYRLPATYVIHAVGPYLDEQSQPQPELLRKTYEQILELCYEYSLHSIALCPISTGFYGHPKELAAQVAMRTVLDWLKSPKSEHMQRIIFVAFDDPNLRAYNIALRELQP